MSCDHVREQLTSYLDGDLEDRDGSAVRGHLRECDACRQVATDEAALRDGLRALPTVDPPPSLWAGVQAQLAAAEVADARRPAWRRAVARWMPTAPRFAAGGFLAAAAVLALWWRTHHGPADEAPTAPSPSLAIAPSNPPPPVRVVTPAPPPSAGGDITADLAGEPARVTATYGQAVDELFALATEARVQWSADQKTAFDAKVTELRGAIDRSPDGRPRQAAQRVLIHYLRLAVINDGGDVALAGGAQ